MTEVNLKKAKEVIDLLNSIDQIEWVDFICSTVASVYLPQYHQVVYDLANELLETVPINTKVSVYAALINFVRTDLHYLTPAKKLPIELFYTGEFLEYANKNWGNINDEHLIDLYCKNFDIAFKRNIANTVFQSKFELISEYITEDSQNIESLKMLLNATAYNN